MQNNCENVCNKYDEICLSSECSYTKRICCQKCSFQKHKQCTTFPVNMVLEDIQKTLILNGDCQNQPNQFQQIFQLFEKFQKEIDLKIQFLKNISQNYQIIKDAVQQYLENLENQFFHKNQDKKDIKVIKLANHYIYQNIVEHQMEKQQNISTDAQFLQKQLDELLQNYQIQEDFSLNLFKIDEIQKSIQKQQEQAIKYLFGEIEQNESSDKEKQLEIEDWRIGIQKKLKIYNNHITNEQDDLHKENMIQNLKFTVNNMNEYDLFKEQCSKNKKQLIERLDLNFKNKVQSVFDKLDCQVGSLFINLKQQFITNNLFDNMQIFLQKQKLCKTISISLDETNIKIEQILALMDFLIYDSPADTLGFSIQNIKLNVVENATVLYQQEQIVNQFSTNLQQSSIKNFKNLFIKSDNVEYWEGTLRNKNLNLAVHFQNSNQQ